MNETLKKILSEVEEHAKAVDALFTKEDVELGKDAAYKMSDADRKAIIDHNKAKEALEVQAGELQEMEAIKNGNRATLKGLRDPQRPTLPDGGDPTQQTESKGRKSLGQQFLDDPQFKEWLAKVAPDGRVPDNLKGFTSPPVQFKDLLTGASDAAAGALVFNDIKPFVALPYRPITILDLITVGTTGSDTVEYPREVSRTNAAAPVAEATAAGGGSGAKPESALVLEKVTTAVKTIAHWIPATKRALSDAGQLRTLIDAFLRQGLQEKLADQVLTGSGVGENLTGILNTTGISTQAYVATGQPLLTTTRKARTTAQVTGKARPTGYVFNPTDWEAIDLLTDNEGKYYFGGPSMLGVPRLWGLPVAEEEGLTVGRGLTGDLRLAVLWNREQSSISVSDSHSDFFIRNLVAILAEMRAAFGVLRPAGLVDIDLTP